MNQSNASSWFNGDILQHLPSVHHGVFQKEQDTRGQISVKPSYYSLCLLLLPYIHDILQMNDLYFLKFSVKEES